MSNEQIAIFAGGCFWCTEPVFSQIKGVKSVVSGYIGGHTTNPTYKEICNGDTGHAEGIKMTFDPARISFDTLLEIFFISHDPTTRNRQGNDIGTQYRSAVFCQDEAQRQSTQDMIARLNAEQIWQAPIVTQINGAEIFYPAEDYHQYYYDKNPDQPYCMAVAGHKVAKIRARYASLLKS
ncbi:MAG TPA: peptide-methionine (S)-S-oxide reductase MsrA [Methylophilaceae bacterium]|nr:peptide-methionine (S)-S-oxide reductase MsrA [Methylophilaceae bacterium]